MSIAARHLAFLMLSQPLALPMAAMPGAPAEIARKYIIKPSGDELLSHHLDFVSSRPLFRG
ncbi:MAG TPA: hypothetical protein VK446_16190 [Methylocystis sp.]|nr:hypothetical protein [Methylocystis sp.]